MVYSHYDLLLLICENFITREHGMANSKILYSHVKQSTFYDGRSYVGNEKNSVKNLDSSPLHSVYFCHPNRLIMPPRHCSPEQCLREKITKFCYFNFIYGECFVNRKPDCFPAKLALEL